LEQELTQVEPDSPEEASALANAVLIENLKERLDQDEVVDEEMLDEILDETTSELELDGVEIPEEENQEEQDDELITTAPLGSSSRPPSIPPPRGPLPPPPPPTLPEPPTPAFGSGSGGITTPNAVANTGNTLNTSPNVLDRRQRAADLLVGGVIGYLIGRRRGRIRTEERLMPVQEKLEGEVKNLQEKIASREEKIRKLAAQKVIEKPEAAPIIVEKLEKKLSPEKTEISQEKKPVVLERLGEVLVPRPETVEIPRKVETMTIPELLDIAQKIEAEGTTVRKMYEAGRLDSVGLKRVVGEYLAGRRVESVLYENLHRYESPEHLTMARPFSPQGSIARGGAAIDQARSSAGQPQSQIQNQAHIPISLPSSGIQSTKKGQQSTTIAIILAVAIGILIALKILIG
ncbi:MAG TPA: hypothetical protein VLG25_03065, partial [Patescibacteria group bacterium]|nr:hypothetical protein [Patescibacteria group bacterium]